LVYFSSGHEPGEQVKLPTISDIKNLHTSRFTEPKSHLTIQAEMSDKIEWKTGSYAIVISCRQVLWG